MKGVPNPVSGFTFTITDLGIFLGKSPVTIRSWERKGEISIPRDEAGNRKLSARDVLMIADAAHHNKRIKKPRVLLIKQAIEALDALQKDIK